MNVESSRLDGVMYIVTDPNAARQWYGHLFQTEIRFMEAFQFEYLLVGGCVMEFLEADHKNQPGTSGQVAYWLVPDFEAFLERACSLGASVYRGPINIEDGRQMAQLLDPFGNIIGVRGGRLGDDGP